MRGGSVPRLLGNDPLVDRSGRRGKEAVEQITLAGDQTQFTVKVWDHRHAKPGAYDLVARIGAGLARLREDDILSFNDDTERRRDRTSLRILIEKSAS